MEVLDTQEQEQRTVFKIPAENMEKFEAQIAKISKRSEKLIGLPIKPFVFGYEIDELADGQKHKVYEVLLTAQLPVLEGWTFMARLDHANETGTIIRMVPNVGELPTEFRHAKATRCDHCNVNRYRRDTFVVRNDETGEFKQVGSTCLKDFFGHDPYKIAKMAELLGYAYECARGGEQFVGGDLRYIDLEGFLTYAAYSCRKNGWVSGRTAYENPGMYVSTKEMAFSYMMARDVDLTDDDRALAADALEWARGFADKNDLNDYEHNVLVIANAELIEPRSLGLAASIVGVFYERRRRETVMPTNVGDFSAVVKLFDNVSKSSPKLTLALKNDDGSAGQKIVLKVLTSGRAPGSVGVTDGVYQGQWFGRVYKDGRWEPSRQVDPKLMTSLTALLTALAADPDATAAEYGRLTGKCCYCNTKLKKGISMQLGYGPDCAKVWGRPYGVRAAAEAAAA